MFYSPMVNRAMRICYEAHAGQVDKAGAPYVFHPIHLAEQMNDEVSCCAALLHDVVEDTDVTFGELLNLGISWEVVEVLRLLTHENDVPYLEYVKYLASHPIAACIKRADLLHNMDMSRFDAPTEVNPKYFEALAVLDASAE